MIKIAIITSFLILLAILSRYNKKQSKHLREKRKEILNRLRNRS